MRRLHSFAALLPLMIMMAPPAEPSSGSGTTLKDQLAAAEKDRDDYKGRADKAETDLKSEQTSHGTTKASLLAAEQARDGFKVRAEKAETDLKTEQDEHAKTSKTLTDLQATDTTATGKAAEALAKNGIVAGKKQDPKKLAEEPADGAALHDQYSKLRGRERAAFFKTHKAALMAHAAANPPEDEDED